MPTVEFSRDKEKFLPIICGRCFTQNVTTPQDPLSSSVFEGIRRIQNLSEEADQAE